MHLQRLKSLHPRFKEGMYLKENTLHVFDKVTQNIAQYPLLHVTYTAAKFEGATSSGLGADAVMRNYII